MRGHGSLPIAFCLRCGHRWLSHSLEKHGQIEQDTYGNDYAGYRDDPVFASGTSRFLRQVLESIKSPPARLLDVGCGAGAFMSIARDRGYSVSGIDISEASARISRQRGLEAIAGDFLTTDFAEQIDIVTMWDVVEHLADPAAFLARARSLLNKDGLLFTKIPGFGSLSVQLSARVPRMGGVLLGAPAHVQFFSRESLAHLFERSGFSFELVDWGSIRQPSSGGPLRKRLARRIAGWIARTSGDEQFYVLARPS